MLSKSPEFVMPTEARTPLIDLKSVGPTRYLCDSHQLWRQRKANGTLEGNKDTSSLTMLGSVNAVTPLRRHDRLVVMLSKPAEIVLL